MRRIQRDLAVALTAGAVATAGVGFSVASGHDLASPAAAATCNDGAATIVLLGDLVDVGTLKTMAVDGEITDSELAAEGFARVCDAQGVMQIIPIDSGATAQPTPSATPSETAPAPTTPAPASPVTPTSPTQSTTPSPQVTAPVASPEQAPTMEAPAPAAPTADDPATSSSGSAQSSFGSSGSANSSVTTPQSQRTGTQLAQTGIDGRSAESAVGEAQLIPAQATSQAAMTAVSETRRTLPVTIEPSARLLSDPDQASAVGIAPSDSGLLAAIIAMTVAAASCAGAALTIRRRRPARHLATARR